MTSHLHTLLNEARFDFIAEADKAFILAFDAAMAQLGYDCRGKIGDGYVWGRYMLNYTKTGVKSDKAYARIYIRESAIVLRFFLSDIDRHRAYLESAPQHIQEPFIANDAATCKHCHNDKDGVCRFRKTYTLHGRTIEKCNGVTFEFHHPRLDRLPDHIALLTEFYPARRPRAADRKGG